jgi:hypothetical protein
LIAGHPLDSLYRAVLSHPKASDEAKESAQDYLTASK